MKNMNLQVSELIEKLQTNTSGLLRTFNVPGLSLVILHDAEVIWRACFGVRSNDTKEIVTEDTVFEAASLSKPLFAYAALQLCEAGVFKLDDPLNDYLPDYNPNEPRYRRSPRAIF